MKTKTPPPMAFGDLVKAQLPKELTGKVEYLLDLKINSSEREKIGKITVLDDYIASSFERITAVLDTMHENRASTWEALNELFLSAL